MDTIIRRLDARAMLVGMNGRVHKVVSEKVEAAFAQAKVRAQHVVDVTAACERVGNSMPQVVVVLGKATDHTDGERLADCAEAVGAGLVYIDPALDDSALEDTINDAVDTAIKRKLMLDDSMRRSEQERANPTSDIPVALDEPNDDVDEGW